MFHQMIEKAVHKSQHCQRNWDLTQEVPEKDLKVMETAITQCPSKQNYAYYKPYIITDRKKIEAIYDQTDGFDYNAEGDTVKNVQVLANVLVAFAEDDQYKTATREDYRELNAIEAVEAGEELPEQVRQRKILGTDKPVHLLMGVGIADESRPRREKHDDPEFVYPTYKKHLDAVRVA
jgi:hypothetical protein